ncbi:MAG: hypothetical protein ACK5JM_09485, partial [Rhodoblastus sp.]
SVPLPACRNSLRLPAVLRLLSGGFHNRITDVPMSWISVFKTSRSKTSPAFLAATGSICVQSSRRCRDRDAHEPACTSPLAFLREISFHVAAARTAAARINAGEIDFHGIAATVATAGQKAEPEG